MTNIYNMVMGNMSDETNRADQHVQNHDVLTLQDIARACLKEQVFSYAEIKMNGHIIWRAVNIGLSNMPIREVYVPCIRSHEISGKNGSCGDHP